MEVVIKKNRPGVLAKYSGQTLVVDPTCVYGDQFHCQVSDPKRGPTRIQVMLADVARVIDDIRDRVVHCDYCGHQVIADDHDAAEAVAGTACPKCQHEWDTTRTPENEGTLRYKDHVGTMQLILGPQKPKVMEYKPQSWGSPSANISKEAHRLRAVESLVEAARKEAETLRMVELMPDDLAFRSIFYGVGYYTDGTIIIELGSLGEIADVMAKLPAAAAVRVKEGSGSAASIIPACHLAEWAERHEGGESHPVCPLFFGVQTTPPSPGFGGHVERSFQYFARLGYRDRQGHSILGVRLEVAESWGHRVFSHHVTNVRKSDGVILSATANHSHPFKTAILERARGGTPGYPTYKLWWEEGTDVGEIANTPLPDANR